MSASDDFWKRNRVGIAAEVVQHPLPPVTAKTLAAWGVTTDEAIANLQRFLAENGAVPMGGVSIRVSDMHNLFGPPRTVHLAEQRVLFPDPPAIPVLHLFRRTRRRA